jgi:competence ComEA-like helix-hairpin-helix protein
MWKSNPSVINIYNSFIKQQRLIICACFAFTCIFLLNCSKTSSNQGFVPPKPAEISISAVNINTANVEELEKLPRIGKEMARRIIEHREKYGNFRRAENLMLVRGMSDKKFREIRSLVKVE